MATLQENIRQANSDFNAIKAKIIEKGVEISEGTKTEEYASKVGQIYDKGIDDERRRFWGILTNYGQPTATMRACFGGRGWTDEIFTPLFGLTPKGDAPYLFNSAYITDIAKCFEDYGTVFDTSLVTSTTSMFAFSIVKRIPFLDFSSVSTSNYTFDGATRLEIIEGIKFSERASFSNTFRSCTALKRMIVSGVIAQNGFNVKDSTLLDKESITSIINTLSSTTSGLTVTLSQTAVNNAFTTEEWDALIATKSNWTITLL